MTEPTVTERQTMPAERLVFSILSPAMDYLRSERVTEVVLNGHDAVFVEESGRLRKVESFLPDSSGLAIVVRLLAQCAGRVLHDGDFELDTTLFGPPTVRVHANFGPTSPGGVSIAIRRLARRRITLDALSSEFGALTTEACAFLRKAVHDRRNILISGGTGVGKTALLNALAAEIPIEERVVTIEDTLEIDLGQPDVVPFLTRRPDVNGRGEVTIRDLLRSALRTRPDRIVIGEVRGGEAFDLVLALGSGHAGSLTTVHADTPSLALSRLHSLAMMSGVGAPSDVLKRQVSEVIDLVVQLGRLEDGSRRVLNIARQSPSEGIVWVLADVFTFDRGAGDKGILVRRTDGRSS